MSRKMRLMDGTLTLCIGLLIAAAVLTLGPTLETKLFPVYTRFQIYSITPTGDGGSEVVFRYNKLRECPPAGVMWFVGEPGGAYRQIDLISNRPPNSKVNRPLGDNTSVPYKVDVAPEVLTARGFATIYNNCHDFWVTQSDIYP